MQQAMKRLSNDGHTELYASYFTPDGPARAALLFHHGMREHRGRYLHFAKELARAGIAVLIYDALGHGQSIPPNEERGASPYAPYDQVLIDDARSFFNELKAFVPEVPYFLCGHSLGTFVLRHLILENPSLDGAIFLGSGDAPAPLMYLAEAAAATSATLTGPHRRNPFTVQLGMALINMPYYPYRTFADWISRDEKACEEFASDPLCNFTYTNEAFSDFYRLIATADNFALDSTTNRQLPVLFLSGTADLVGGFGQGIPVLERRAKKSGFRKVEAILYPDARHDLLHEINAHEVIDDLLNWLNRQIASAAHD